MPQPVRPTMTHAQRMALIHKQIPIVRYIHAMPHAGTITGDHFYDGDALETATGYRNAHITKEDFNYATRLYGFNIFAPADGE